MDQLKEKNYQFDEEEIALFDYLWVIWKRKLLIALIVAISVCTTYVFKIYFFKAKPPIYEAKAIIKPSIGMQGGAGGVSQIGGTLGSLVRMAGISVPGSKSSGDLIVWFNSNTLKEKIVKKYDLLPVLFSDQWDSVKKQWKTRGQDLNSSNPKRLSRTQTIKRKFIIWINPEYYESIQPRHKNNQDKPPSEWDGAKVLGDIMKAEPGKVDGTLEIIAEYRDAQIAAKLVEYFLAALNEQLSDEARETAATNKKFLEGLLDKTVDPIVRQKIYNMIAQEIEREMMSDAKENFGFQVVDYPRVPDQEMPSEDKDRTLIISLIISLVFAIFLVFLLESARKKRQPPENTAFGTDKEPDVEI